MQNKEEELVPTSISNLLMQVKTAQNQNGLRNNQDYGKYHQYCKNRVSRLRKALRHTHHPKNFNADQGRITGDLVAKDTRYLLVQLFSVEAAWAYAMQMKQVQVNANSKKETQHISKGEDMA